MSGRPGLEFERVWRALIVAHGIVHRIYLGGTLGPDHMSFEDPWVFLEGDVIQLTIEPDAVPATEIEFVLALGSDPFWWKGLRLPDGAMLEVEDTNALPSRVRSG